MEGSELLSPPLSVSDNVKYAATMALVQQNVNVYNQCEKVVLYVLRTPVFYCMHTVHNFNNVYTQYIIVRHVLLMALGGTAL